MRTAQDQREQVGDVTRGEGGAAAQHGDLDSRHRGDERHRQERRQPEGVRRVGGNRECQRRRAGRADGGDVEPRHHRGPVHVRSPSSAEMNGGQIPADAGDLASRMHLPVVSGLRAIHGRHGARTGSHRVAENSNRSAMDQLAEVASNQ